MTDNEIIKALECCIGEYGVRNCDNCPNMGYGCIEVIPRIALDLINRQKAEVEKLKIYSENLEISQEHLLNECAMARKTAKSEAIKEFSERLKEKKHWDIDVADYVFVDDINNLVKEMTKIK